MSQLSPDYSKRDCSLPPGCKDLIDLLQPSKRMAEGQEAGVGPWPSFFKHDRFATAGLAQIASYVSRALESPAEIFALYMSPLDEQVVVVLCRTKNARTFEMVLLINSSGRDKLEQASQAFFHQHGIQSIQYCFSSNTGAPDSDLPRSYLLQFDASRVSELTMNLLRVVYGLNDGSGLDFRYVECGPAAV